LIVFGRCIGRSMLIPVRVEIMHDLATRTRSVKIHARLKEPIPVHGSKGAQASAISAVMDGDSIVETEYHVWIGK
jgi:hypothetical protein